MRVNATNIDDPDTFTAGGPCTEHDDGYWVNVAARESDIPSFFSGLGISAVSSIGATRQGRSDEARVPRAACGRSCSKTRARSRASARRLQGVAERDRTVACDVAARRNGRERAPAMPPNDTFVTVKRRLRHRACRTTRQRVRHAAFKQGLSRSSPIIRLAPTLAASCTNGNPYFIPRNGSPCQIEVTATVSFATATDQFVRAQVGSGGAFDLVQGSGNDWTGTFTVNPEDGTGPNGTQPVRIFAKNSRRPGGRLRSDRPGEHPGGPSRRTRG